MHKFKQYLEISPQGLQAHHRKLGPFDSVRTFHDGWRKWFWVGHASCHGAFYLKVMIGPFTTERQAARAWDHCPEEKTAPKGWWRRLFTRDRQA